MVRPNKCGRRRGKGGESRRFVFSFLASVIGVLIGLGLVGTLIEIAVTVRSHSLSGEVYEQVPQFNSASVFRVKPHQVDTGHAVPYKYNNLGMRRDTDVSLEPSPASYRILSYGDSIAFGVEVKLEDHYTGRLEKLLPGTEVLNMARGHSASIHSFHVRQDVPALRPQALVLEIELTNDLGDEAMTNTEGWGSDGLPERIRGARYSINSDGRLLSSVPWKGYSFESTLLYSDLSRRIGSFLSSTFPNPMFGSGADRYFYNFGFDQYFITKARIELAFERMFRTIRGIQEYCRKQGIEFVLVIMPSRYIFYPNAFQGYSEQLVVRAEAKARELGIPFISMKEIFRANGGANLMFDFCHPWGSGYRLVADQLYRHFSGLKR